MEEPSAEDQRQLELRRAIIKIMMDSRLTEAEKAQKRQELMCGEAWAGKPSSSSEKENGAGAQGAAAGAKGKLPAKEPQEPTLLDDTLKCAFCFNLCERPITGPCQHNFCLGCFKRWLAQGKKTCPTCRTPFPAKFADNPRINTALTAAIRLAKQGVRAEPKREYARINDSDRPDEAFTTERAVRSGRANAASGRIMVTVPNDHFGPIGPEYDPQEGKGVWVGRHWADRLDCRQWGAHFPHVAGIAGQSNIGAQSVVLSGGYEDDRDEGEWFLYTGSGGRDLSGNKRTNKMQSFDQKFEQMNKALKLSCTKGLPVRVVRSFKEKRSSYAPTQDQPVRYDGIYRIARCWRKKGAQGFLMCRYLFIRCDNDAAPWSSDERGDLPRDELPKAAAEEMKGAEGPVFEMGCDPYWDYNPETKAWGWAKPPPPSQKVPGGGGDTAKKLRKKASEHERLLRDFSCGLCKAVLTDPLSMPCGHNFCKGCLDKRFEGTLDVATCSARSLRVRKVPKPCPSCKADIGDFLSGAAVNREMMAVIHKLQEAAEKARLQAEKMVKGGDDEDEDGLDDAEGGGEEEASDDELEEVAEGSGEGKEGAAGDTSSDMPEAERTCTGGTAAAVPVGGSSDGAGASCAAPVPTGASSGAAGGTSASEGARRYAGEAAALKAAFPQFDEALIVMLLEDQGGDVDEVHAYLKRMKNQELYSRRAAAGSGKPPAAARSQKGAGNREPASCTPTGNAFDHQTDGQGNEHAASGAAAQEAGAGPSDVEVPADPLGTKGKGSKRIGAKPEHAAKRNKGA